MLIHDRISLLTTKSDALPLPGLNNVICVTFRLRILFKARFSTILKNESALILSRDFKGALAFYGTREQKKTMVLQYNSLVSFCG